MKTVMTDLQKASLDAYKGASADKQFSAHDLNDIVRNAITSAVGGEWNYYAFMDKRYQVFAVISEVLPVAVNASLGGRFDGIADFKDEAMGDETSFQVFDNSLYKVVTAARGTKGVERQTLVDKNFKVPTAAKMVRIYTELDLFMAGRVDWTMMVARVADSIANEIGIMVANAIYSSYTDVATNNKATGAFDADTLMDIIEHVKAATGAVNVNIMGTSTALGRIADGFGYSNDEKQAANGMGYYGQFRGTSLIQLPQAYLPKTDTFAVNRNYVIVAPADEKLVKVALEGPAVVEMSDAMLREDLQPEFLFGRRIGAAAIVVPDNMFGLFRFA